MQKNEVVKDSAYNALYTKIKELRLKQINSPEYKQYTQLSREYFSKMIRKYDEPESDVGTKAWLEDNWKYKTKFLSYESALKAREALDTAFHAAFSRDTEFNNLLIKSIQLYGPQLTIELEKEIIRIQHPELKQL